MSAYNAPTETLPRFNSAVFVQNANVSYPVAQGALTIPKNITIVDGSNTIIITPTSITINGIVYSLSNIAYLNLSQTFTGVNTFSNTLKANTLQSLLTTDNISLYDTSTAEISIGSGNAGNINIGSTSSAISLKGANTFINGYTLTNTLKSLNSTSSVSLYEVPMVSLSMGNSSSPNTITGYTNTINGNTTFTNTIIGNTITGKAVGDAISLYNTSTGLITLGNSTLGTNTNTIYGITTFNQALNAQTPASLINNTQVPTTAYLTTYYAPLTGTIANATAITLTPNSTDTADYIPFSSTASGSSNLKTSTVLLYNASTGNLSSTIYTTNTLQGQAVSSAISLYTTSTSGGISLGNSSNTNTINGNTTFSNYVFLTAIRAVTPTAGVSLFDTMTSGSISIGGASQTGGINIGTTGSNTVTINGGSFIVSPSMYVNTIIGKAVANNISLYGTTTGTITLGNAGVSANTITGVTNVITGSTSNTINGNTTITNTLLGNTLTGKAVTDAISLYTTSTSGGISLGNSSNTNTINGNTTITNTLYGNTLQGTTVSSSINLYTLTTGTITIGNTSGTNTINGVTTLNNYITTSIFNPIVSTNSLLNMILSNKTGSISGQNNTGLGVGSLSALTTGRDNTAIGTNALITITDQNYSTAVGSGALGQVTTTGIDGGYNTAVGSNAGNSLKYGKYNCFFGQLAGTNMSVYQADYNTFLGAATSFIVPNTGFSNSTAIGYGAIITASNQIMLGRVSETVIAPNNITITNTLNGNTLAGKTTTDAISLYTTSTSGGIILGNSSNTNTINGNTTITNTLLGNTITGKAVTDNISLFTTTTTGTMNFVSGLTTGICYIGNSVSTTGQMIIYGAVSGTSTLFSNVVAGAISIGNSALTGVMTIYGSISNTNNLFTNVTTGAINIGTSCSGIVTIGKTVQSPNPNSTVNIVATDLPIYGNLQLRGKYGQSIYNLNQSQYYTTSSTLSSPLYQYNIACFSSNGTLTIPDAADAYIGVALYFKNACNPSTVTMTIKTVSSNNFFGLTAGSIPTTLTGQQIMVVCITYAFGSPVSTAPVWVQMI